MKSKQKVLIAAGALLLLLVAAALIYRALTLAYAPEETLPAAETEEAAPAEAAERPYAPDFTMLDAEGNEVRLVDFLGETPVVLNFWASWCPPCKAELPAFDAAYFDRGEEINFLMVDLADGVQETEESAMAYLTENGFAFPAYFVTTGEAVSAYQLYSIPMTVAIDREGRIVSTRIGALSEESLAALLDALEEA